MKPHTGITECRRCGTCCRKGGPTLHLEDRPLVEAGIIPLANLLTIRQGEPAYDNVSDTIAPAVTDIVKINDSRDGRKGCCFYNTADKGCGIYADRPAECAALKCWDTRSIEALYNCRRLTRQHLLAKVQGLWDLVRDHQDRCEYGYIAELAEKVKRPHCAEEHQQALLELVRYDDNLRQLTCERSRLDPRMLLFLFGRPLSFTIQMFRLKVVQTPQGMQIQPLGPVHRQTCYRRQ